jgi:hypothetical protein
MTPEEADRRGLAALAARVAFATPPYVALRMTPDLAKRGVKGTAAHGPMATTPCA